MTPREILALCREHQVRAIDLRFMDFPGTLKHFTIPVQVLTEKSFEEGFDFDASSMYGWQAINESDMLVVPQPETAFVDPFLPHTLCLSCNIQDPITRVDYAKDPRNVARKADAYLKSTGIADEIRFGLEPEFFIFDNVRFDQTINQGYYHLESAEGEWARGKFSEGPQSNAGYQIRKGEGYFPVPPGDILHSLRNDMMMALTECGIEIEAHHHEVATGGQAEIDLAHKPLLQAADLLLRFKYIVKNVASRAGKTVTFMPKPLWGDNGSGLHMHLSLWKDGETLFADSGYGGLSELALHAMGGILHHAPAIMAFCCPTTNSYKRLVPGFDAPINLTYSFRNRSAAIRIPVHTSNRNSKRFELRFPDSSSNPYLAMSAIVMAALDGIQNKIDPGPPLDKDIYDLEPGELDNSPKTPVSLDKALDALRADHDFLLRGDVFTEDVIDTWIWYKTERDVKALRERPHPCEFLMYYDI
ncbi:type I glutamate--ammonia ligase [Rubinisphaera italica]|uniref:Glutamine synthetase n=1 Tax=Rubinisphaera italica TaxID=2527969 RepID=A0A5C5XIC2_9PLAN|nr:type I glutamate--ammonia ligase [Rubinisphaera italica]TWT62101.1 Glutamine synthetase 1 [Rubinisphaera italica]